MAHNFDVLYTEVNQLHFIEPQSVAPGSISTGWVDMKNFSRFCAKVNIGVITVSGTVDAKIEQAQDGAGAGVKDLTDHAGTVLALTQVADVTGDNTQHTLEGTDEQLDTANGYTHIRLTVTTAVAAALIAGELAALVARYEPVAQPNLTQRVVSHPVVPHTIFA